MTAILHFPVQPGIARNPRKIYRRAQILQRLGVAFDLPPEWRTDPGELRRLFTARDALKVSILVRKKLKAALAVERLRGAALAGRAKEGMGWIYDINRHLNLVEAIHNETMLAYRLYDAWEATKTQPRRRTLADEINAVRQDLAAIMRGKVA
jgi:predicted short-subunit dehydrogenase-like oxidoreductase (DUF2520 family)